MRDQKGQLSVRGRPRKGALHSKLVKQNWPPFHHFSSDMAHLLICWEHLAHLENSIPFFMHFDIFELFWVTGVYNVKHQK